MLTLGIRVYTEPLNMTVGLLKRVTSLLILNVLKRAIKVVIDSSRNSNHARFTLLVDYPRIKTGQKHSLRIVKNGILVLRPILKPIL